MSTASIAILVICAIVILSAAFAASIYNRLVTLRQRVLNAFSQIDVQLKRRHDLIPNLVESVKGYMAHEKSTLERVVAARNAAAAAREVTDPRSAGAVAVLAGLENQLMGALGQLIGLKEAYPSLKADQNAGRLMEELSSTENRVAFARQAYNDGVMLYNTAIQSVPSNLIAAPFGFAAASLFEIEDVKQRDVVAVRL